MSVTRFFIKYMLVLLNVCIGYLSIATNNDIVQHVRSDRRKTVNEIVSKVVISWKLSQYSQY